MIEAQVTDAWRSVGLETTEAERIASAQVAGTALGAGAGAAAGCAAVGVPTSLVAGIGGAMAAAMVPLPIPGAAPFTTETAPAIDTQVRDVVQAQPGGEQIVEQVDQTLETFFGDATAGLAGNLISNALGDAMTQFGIRARKKGKQHHEEAEHHTADPSPSRGGRPSRWCAHLTRGDAVDPDRLGGTGTGGVAARRARPVATRPHRCCRRRPTNAAPIAGISTADRA